MAGSGLDDAAGAGGATARLFAALRSGETRALGRAVSLVEDGAPEAAELLALCHGALKGKGRVLRVGVTGPAGAGKSTLVDALVRELRGHGRRVGIVAVDPSSVFTGGAILGDRIRLADFAEDRGVYMRSMATRGHLGGLAEATDDVLTVIESAWGERGEPYDQGAVGGDVLLIETTGVGQGEIEVVRLADLVAVVLVPGMGDGVQSLKAGVLEIASVFVLNKADREGIERLEMEIGEMLGFAVPTRGKVAPKMVRTVATTGLGVGELMRVVDELASSLERRAREEFETCSGGAKPGSGPVVKDSVTRDGAVMDHLGLAVRSIELARGMYEALGIAVSDIEEVAHEQVRVAMLKVGESRIELLEATDADSVVGRFLAKRGEGLHHMAIRVPDLTAAIERLKRHGARLVSEKIQVGAGGHRYVFVHPASANGLLLELVDAGAEHEGGKL